MSQQGVATATATGDGAQAVVVTGGGNVGVSLDTLTTGGAQAPALSITAGGAATVQVSSVTTGGERSPGIVVDAAGPVDLTAGSVTTSGNGSSGIIVGSGGGITLNVPSITINGSTSQSFGGATTGPDSLPVSANGVEATSRGGDITIVASSLAQNGDGEGVIATSYGGGIAASVTTSGGGNIFSNGGPAFDLSALSATVDVAGTGTATTPAQTITYPTSGDPARAGVVTMVVDKDVYVGSYNAPVVRITAVNSTSLTNNGTIATYPWQRAIEITGGAATIVNNGEIYGTMRLSENADTFINNGSYTASGVTAFDDNETAIGQKPNTGKDVMVNTGTIRVDSGVTYAQYPVYSGLDVFRNSGLIDLRSGTAGDLLQFGATAPANAVFGAPTVLGQYIASGNATIALDLQFQANNALVDTVSFSNGVGNPLAVSGNTKVILNVLAGATPKLLIGLPVIVVPSGSTGTFTLSQPMVMGGLQYALLYDPRQTAWALYAAPDEAVLRQAKVPTDVQSVWVQASDAVSSHLREERDRRWTDAEPRSRLWLQAVGSTATRTESYSATINRIPISGVDFSQRQTSYGVQGGIDSAGPESGKTGIVAGATVGYLQSTAQFRATGEQVKIDALDVGGYASLLAGPAYLTASAIYARHSVDDQLDEVASIGKLRGDSYGVRVETGVRLGSDTFFVEPSASITYAITSVDTVALTYGQAAFDDLTSKNGTAGLRVGGRLPIGNRELVYYAGGEAVHEFAGDDQVRLSSGGNEVVIPTYRLGTYGRGTLGVTLVNDRRSSVFVEGQGVYGSGYKGGGGRVGVRLAL